MLLVQLQYDPYWSSGAVISLAQGLGYEYAQFCAAVFSVPGHTLHPDDVTVRPEANERFTFQKHPLVIRVTLESDPERLTKGERIGNELRQYVEDVAEEYKLDGFTAGVSIVFANIVSVESHE